MGVDEYDFSQVDAQDMLAGAANRIKKADSKDTLIKILKEAYGVLEGSEQGTSMQEAVVPLAAGLSTPNLLENSDKGVRIYLAACFVQTLRISAPEAPYEEEAMKGLFTQVINVFELLRDASAASFRVCASVLQAFAAVKCGILMWDLGVEGLVERLFQALLYSVSAKNEDTLSSLILQTLAYMLEEADDIPQALVDTILECLESPEAHPARTRLVQRLLKQSESTLCMYLQKTLTRVVEAGGDPYHNHHKLLLAVHQAVPQLLLPVLPHLCLQLEAEEEAKRLGAVETAGHLFSRAEAELAGEYPELFAGFLRRFIDQKVEVRVEALSFAVETFRACTTVECKTQVLTAAVGRLMDTEERVRVKAVAAVCSMGAEELSLLDPSAIRTAIGRTRDSKAAVRREAAASLAAMFRGCCRAILNGSTADVTQAVLEVPGALLLGSHSDPDPSVRAALVAELQEGLLPGGDFPAENAAQIWAQVFLQSSEISRQALGAFLARKRRFQDDLAALLRAHGQASRLPASSGGTDEADAAAAAVSVAAKRVAEQLPEPGRAAEHLRKLLLLKDRNVFRGLQRLAEDAHPDKEFDRISSEVLRAIGATRSGTREFSSSLVRQLRSAPLNPAHLRGLLAIAADRQANPGDAAVRGSLGLLSLATTADPKLFRGLLEPVVDLLEAAAGEGAASGRETCACRILAAAGPVLAPGPSSQAAEEGKSTDEGKGKGGGGPSAASLKAASRAFPILSGAARKRRGTAKFAGKALAVLAVAFGDKQQLSIATSELMQRLVADRGRCSRGDEAEEDAADALAMLEALSGIARVEPDSLAPHVEVLQEAVMGEFLADGPPPPKGKKQKRQKGGSKAAKGARAPYPVEARAEALKLLVRALVPDDAAAPIPVQTQAAVEALLPRLDGLLDPDTDLEAELGIQGEAAHGRIRLSAATALLRLARRHDAAIPVQNYINLALVAQDPMMEVRSEFTSRVLKTAKHFEARRMHHHACKYLAILSLSAMDPTSSTQARVAAELGDFISGRRRTVRAASTAQAYSSGRGGCNLPDQPEFMLPYVVFVLAHHPDFPEAPKEAEEEELRPWEHMLAFVLEQLLSDKAAEHGSSLPAIGKTLLTLKLSGDTLTGGPNDNICAVCDLGMLLCGGAERLQALPSFPARIPLPRALYQALDRDASAHHKQVGSHLRPRFQVQRVLGEAEGEGTRNAAPSRGRKKVQGGGGVAPGDRKRQRKPRDPRALSPPHAGATKAAKAAPLSSPVTPAEQTPAPAVIDVETQGLRKRRQQDEGEEGPEEEEEGGSQEAAHHNKHGRLMEEENGGQEGASRGGSSTGASGKGKQHHHQQRAASPVPIGKATPQKQALRDIPLNRTNRPQTRSAK